MQPFSTALACPIRHPRFSRVPLAGNPSKNEYFYRLCRNAPRSPFFLVCLPISVAFFPQSRCAFQLEFFLVPHPAAIHGISCRLVGPSAMRRVKWHDEMARSFMDYNNIMLTNMPHAPSERPDSPPT